MTITGAIIAGVLLGLGLAAGWLAGVVQRTRLQSAVAELRRQLAERESVTAAVAPLATSLQTLTERVERADSSRVTADTVVREQINALSHTIATSVSEVRQETRKLSHALTHVGQRGAWGELQLRRILEIGGLVEDIHFETQLTVTTPAGADNPDPVSQRRLRPDVVVHLAGDRRLVIDAKVPLDALLSTDSDDTAAVRAHTKAVLSHVDALSSREYWRYVGDSTEFVILFMPAESLLAVALQERPDLLVYALDRRVLLATPTTLLATLRGISLAWQHVELSDAARDIHAEATLLYRRLCTMGTHFQRLGRDLNNSVQAYNDTVGSLQTRVLPSARRLQHLSPDQDDPPEQVEIQRTSREVTSSDLLAGIDELMIDVTDT